jgi:hypothetical protein
MLRGVKSTRLEDALLNTSKLMDTPFMFAADGVVVD